MNTLKSKHLLTKSIWAILDQALFAGTNFIISITLARFITIEEYGSFSAAYSLFLFTGTIQTSYGSEPMSIYGASVYSNSLKYYFKLLTLKQNKYTIITSSLLLVVAVYFYINKNSIYLAIIGLSISMPFILYLWLIRRVCYIIHNPKLAVIGGVIYMISYLAVIYLYSIHYKLNSLSALLCMGIASYIASIFINFHLKKEIENTGENVNAKVIINKHIEYGNWAIISNLISWLISNIYFILLPTLANIDDVANFKAIMNIVMPVLHLNVAISNLFIPIYVKAIKTKEINKIMIPTVILTFSASIVFFIIFSLYGEYLIKLLYNNKYQLEYKNIILISISPMFSSIISSSCAILKAYEQQIRIARLYFIGCIYCILFSTVLIYLTGLNGAVIALVSTNLFLSIIFASNLIKTHRKENVTQNKFVNKNLQTV